MPEAEEAKKQETETASDMVARFINKPSEEERLKLFSPEGVLPNSVSQIYREYDFKKDMLAVCKKLAAIIDDQRTIILLLEDKVEKLKELGAKGVSEKKSRR